MFKAALLLAAALLALTVIASAAVAATPGFSVKDYGAKADGLTDDRAAIAKAAAAAVAAGQKVYFPAGTYRIAGPMSAFAGASYYGTGATLQLQGPIAGASRTTFEGLQFQCYGATVALTIGSKTAAVTNMTVKNCTFAAGSGQFTWSRIIVFRGSKCVIDRNTFTGTKGSGGNIQVLGGADNQITNNTITGGTTSILFMWSRSSNGGAADSIIQHNTVAGNTYSGFSEEGISFDIKANSANDCGALEYDTIKAVSGQTLTLSSVAFPAYTGFEIVFVDGKLAGKTRTITAQANPNFTVTGSLAGAAAGDHVVIGAVYKHNTVSGNTGSASGSYPAILLYGLCFGNTVRDNTLVTGKISVRSLDNTPVATGNATRVAGRAPCGFNTIQNNTMQDTATGKVTLEYVAFSGSTYAPYVTQGNNVLGNTVALISGANQNAYLTGNSGTTNFSNVTLAGALFAFDGQ